MEVRRLPAPMLTAVLLVLLGTMVLFWGRQGGGGSARLRTATVRNVRAELADGGCVFTADVQLHGLWQQWTFTRIRLDARKAFVTLLRTRRRYMVDNAVAREALGVEMTYAVNRLAHGAIAERVDFPSFEVF